MKTTLSLFALFTFVLVGGYLWNVHTTNSVGLSLQTNTSATSTQATESTTAATYSLAQVASHNTANDCWVSINGGVYDLTSWISQHPGGQAAILSICGKDGSAAFSGQHGRDPRAQAELANFKIGDAAP